MRSRHSSVLALFVLEAALLSFACSDKQPPADEDADGGTAGTLSGARGGSAPIGGNAGKSGSGGTAGASGSSGGSLAGSSGSGGGSGSGSGNGGTSGGSAAGGSAGSGGSSAGSAGLAAGGSSAGDAGMGGSLGGASAGDGGLGGGAGTAAGTSGSAGSGGGSTLHGGASGAFVCPANPGSGDPLAGMSAITTISPPTMTQPSFFAFVEGPVWIASLGKLFFSDNAGSPERIWQLTPGMTPSVFFEGSGSNGLAIDSDDQLIITDQVGNRITRVDPTAASPSHALIAAANSKPNDVIVRSDGNIYFSAPNGTGTGFYRIDPSGMRTGPRTEVNQPNGIVLSPDENTLYVDDVGNRSITSFAIASDGSIGATGTPFATTTNQTADGMCVDCAGNLYVSTANGVEVFSPTATPRGTVMVGEASNCTFGGPDRRTLYVTSRSVVKAVTLAIPGLPD